MRLYIEYVPTYPEAAPVYKVSTLTGVDHYDLEEFIPTLEEKVRQVNS